ncbi:uncharacterized protein ACA1_219710 [Acanthamoeba castellanii str. Neff]|uniref:Uncharacterized protein n=1 Tax=Acanthamoeba castellanii (strain ATCC 30010 / Neff) TaxID=1257118 RepID=L8GQH7_ACACF|nr:uncharacterized protein ACA1_219710 [Acanthamoeba castellanii str. Neff]ELR15245.1 hypothetical protein ACA1_219710 [Acanthamoeba castellanii str. Neff]
MSMRGNSSTSSGGENRKRDKEYASSLVPEVLEDLRKPDNYHRLRDRNSRSTTSGSRIGSSSSGGGSSSSSSTNSLGAMLSTGERKRGNTASSGDRSGSGTVVLAASEKRDKYASGARRDSLVGGGGSGSSGSSSSIGSGSGSGRKEGRGVDSLPPALKEDLEIFKRELVKHLRKEMSRLKDDLIDDLRREFAAFRQN